MQKSQKGSRRGTAAPLTQEVSRTSRGPRMRPYRGSQQFGGVSQLTDQGAQKRSPRAKRGVKKQVSRSKPGGGQ